MRKLLAFLFITTFFQFKALAEVTNVSFTGSASYIDVPNLRAYATFAGPSGGTSDVYNSCADDSLDLTVFTNEGCSFSRVSLNTPISISFQETSDSFSGQNRLAKAFLTLEQNGQISDEITAASSTTISAPNTTVTLSFTWGDVCNQLSGASTSNDRCNVNGQINILFGIDNGSGGVVSNGSMQFTIYTPAVADTAAPLRTVFDASDFPTTDGKACDSSAAGESKYNGMCDFEVAPGDEKASILVFSESAIGHGLSFANSSVADVFTGSDESSSTENFQVEYKGIVVCDSPDGFNFTFPWSDDVQCTELDLENPGTSTLDDFEISGLSNGTTYYFRGMTIDLLDNLSMLFEDEIINAYCGTTTTLGSPAAVDACPFAATPQLVVGLISENKCFITTATFGSDQAYQVKLFREFRSKFLWTNSFGLFLSKTYNQYGPLAANWIYKNPWSKNFVRIGLYPFYWFAYSSLKIGFFLTSFILLLTGLGLFVSLKRWGRIRS